MHVYSKTPKEWTSLLQAFLVEKLGAFIKGVLLIFHVHSPLNT